MAPRIFVTTSDQTSGQTSETVLKRVCRKTATKPNISNKFDSNIQPQILRSQPLFHTTTTPHPESQNPPLPFSYSPNPPSPHHVSPPPPFTILSPAFPPSLSSHGHPLIFLGLLPAHIPNLLPLPYLKPLGPNNT